jgi:hypothetical protein
MQGVNFSEKSLTILANYTRDWPGRKIGKRNIVTVINESGSAPPLVWVFNGGHPAPVLSEALGPDQPLIAMRSLIAVVRTDKIITWDQRLLAKAYAEEIRDYLGNRPFFVAGNCVGAPVASEIAGELLLSGCEVRGFVGMEFSRFPPMPLACTFLFGDESDGFNPFLSSSDPTPMWQRLYAKYNIDILPGKHGTYFLPETLPILVDYLQTALSANPELRRAQQAAAVLTGLPKSVRANEVLTLEAGSADGLDPDDDVVFLWDSHFHGLPHREIAQAISHHSGKSRLRVNAPATPGIWTLQTFRCRSGHGPIAWAEETRIYYRIEVFGEDESVEFVDAGR